MSEQKNGNENFRVGFDTASGMTTLTFLAPRGDTMTLSMTKDVCERMIRMLRATYELEQKENNESLSS